MLPTARIRRLFSISGMLAVCQIERGSTHWRTSDGSHAGLVLVFIRTSPFRQAPQYSRTSVTPLIRPTADTMHITLAAIQGLKSIFAPGYQIAKAGVMLLDLQPQSVSQGELDFG